MLPSAGGRHSERLAELVDRALLKDLQRAASPFALDLPELKLEATVLNRLAVLEVLCTNQAQTIELLQRENSRLQSCLTATTSYHLTSSDTCQPGSIEHAAHYAAAFVPFKGRSHTIDANQAPASSIAAVHQHTLTSSTHTAALAQTLNTTPSALRPLQREEFLAKLPKVVIRGGQLLPIRSCIEAFIKGDETALQTALAQSSPELQTALADMAVGLQHRVAASAHPVSHTEHGRSRLTAAGNCASTPDVSAGIKRDAPYGESAAKSYVAGTERKLGSAGRSNEVVLHPPRAADVQRSAQDSVRDAPGQMLSNASQDAASPMTHHSRDVENQAGCDQLVQYVLRELLG